MHSGRLLRLAPLFVVALLAPAACGGGGPSRDEFIEAANTVCNESNEDAEDIDPPDDLEGAVAYADDAKEVVADRILELDELDVPSDEESALADYLDGLEDERDTLIELADADAGDSDAVRGLVEEVRDLEEENRDLAEELDLGDCADASEGETVAVALDAEDEPEPTDDTVPPDDGGDGGEDPPVDGDLGDDPIGVLVAFDLPLGTPYTGTQEITDDSGNLSMTVPTEWVDVDGSPSDDGSFNLDATPDIDAFTSGFTVPGVLFAAATGAVDIEDLLTRFTPQACIPVGQGDYADGIYTGRFQVATDCGGTSTIVLVVSAQADDGTHGVLVQIGIVTEQDIDAAEQILNSFLANSAGF